LLSAQVNESRQQLLNEVYQSSQETCAASCENIQSGNVVFLDGSTSGDITFEQKCTADANCMMDQSLQSVADLLLELKQGNTTEASLFGGGFNIGAVNLNLSNQDIKNQVTQIMQALCTADVSNVQNGNMVYARNSKTGKISFSQEGDAHADCVMQNSASAAASLKAKATQSNSLAASLGAFGAFILFAIVLAVILGIMNKKKGGDQGGPPSQQQQNQNQNQQGQQGTNGFNMQQLANVYGGRGGGGNRGRGGGWSQ
jgi:hypothetical protein